jgi:hypothetical protein
MHPAEITGELVRGKNAGLQVFEKVHITRERSRGYLRMKKMRRPNSVGGGILADERRED